jgi:predicted NUDIX family NTP pyrophosphohydrolase
MAVRSSAGLLVYRRRDAALQVFLVHPGGPFWARKDEGAWSIPKGERGEGEEPLAAAQREFLEETGIAVTGEFLALRPVRQAGGKVVHAFALAADLDADAVKSNTFTMEWPPKSGRVATFPEVDRAQWFSLAEARAKILAGQLPLHDELADLLGLARGSPGPE